MGTFTPLMPGLSQRVPLDYLDKLCLSGTSRERGVSSSPVWQLRVKGDFDESLALRAVAELVARYPLLASRVVAEKPRADWERSSRLVYEIDAEPDIEKIFRSVDLSSTRDPEQQLVALQRGIFDHVIHPVETYSVLFTWVRTAKDEGVLFLQQNHGIADGKAFFELIADLCRCYDLVAHAEEDQEGLVAVGEVGKLGEAEMAVPGRWKRLWYTLCGVGEHLWQLGRATLRPPEPLACNIERDFTGHNNVIHLLLRDELLGQLKPLREKVHLSVNDLIGGALAKALERWSGERGTPVRRYNFLVVADARPRRAESSQPVRSFANHLCSYLVDLDAARLTTPIAMARAIHDQVSRQHARAAHIKKLLVEIAVTRRLTIERIRNLIFQTPRAVLNYSFSNLIPISPRDHGGRFATRSWSGESLRIMTPSPYLQGVNTTVIRYGGYLCFNFNFKESVVDHDSVKQLISGFVDALDEVIIEASSGGVTSPSVSTFLRE